MEFSEVVNTRRSVFKFTDTPIAFDDVLPLLSLANLAPNHHLTQPWQFLWIGDQTKLALAQYYAQARASKKVSTDDPRFNEELSRARDKFLRTPAILITACRLNDDPIIAEEDYAATCCAIQNFLLGVTHSGLGAQWSSHPMIRTPEVRSLLGLTEQYRLVAMLYLGYPALIPPAPPRQPVENFVQCLP